MKYRLFVISILLTIVGKILADNVSVADINLVAGEEKQIAINLTNETNKYVAFQFDLSLPTGVSVAKEGNEFVASLNGDRVNDHTLTVGALGNNVYRFLSYSGNNSEFIGSSGALVYVKLKAADNLPFGNHTAKVINQKFTVKSGSKFTLEDTSFIISNPEPAPAITVTAKDASRDYGEANPTFEYVVSGGTLQGEPVLTCTATPQSAVGQYDIVISNGSVINENVTFVNGTLTVTKTPLAIKADDKQMTQGDPLPEFTVSYTGFKNNETEAVLAKKPMFQCAATPDSEAGTYDITPYGAEAQNYEITYVGGILSINPKPVVVNDKFSVDNVELEVGGEQQVSISLVNDNKYVAFQFDIVLPQGISVAKDENGRFVSSLIDSRIVDHTLSVGEMDNNTYRFLVYSATNLELVGNGGPIVEVMLAASSTMTEGSYSASVTNQKVTDKSGTKQTFDDFSFGVLVKPSTQPIEEITIKVKDAARLYGDANPIFEYEVTGGTLQGEPAISCVATPTSPVGKYDITISQGSVTNEHVIFINGTLDVKKTPLVIKADDKQITQGDQLPEFTASYSGFKNNETENILQKQPEFQCEASSNSPSGLYDIIPFGAEAKNYEISYIYGILTVISPTPSYVIITNSTAGQLADQISASGYSISDISSMKIVGNLNGTDIKLLRNMILDEKLTALDIKECNIVSGGDPYYESYSQSYFTENNVIGENAFYFCSKLVSMELPASVTAIEPYAFYGCGSMSTLSLPVSITSIGTSAFHSCSALRAIYFPEGLVSIGNGAFENCGKMTEITIPSSVKFIGTEAFAQNNLTSISVSQSNEVYDSREECNAIIETANNRLISGCASTKVPESVTTIGENAFYFCSKLVSMELPASVTAIEPYAFYGCGSMSTLSLPVSITSIGTSAFHSCSALRAIYFPEGLVSIGNGAFENCGKMTEITIPSSVKFIGTEAFAQNNLTSISVSQSNEVYDSREECNAIIETANNRLISGCASTKVPESVTTIGENAFYFCSKLLSMELPTSVTAIEQYAFYGCKNLAAIWSYIEDFSGDNVLGNSAFSSINAKCIWHVVEGTSDYYKDKKIGWVDSWKIIDDIPSPSDIISIQYDENGNGAWYNLQGVRLEGRPLKRGIYLNNGRKVLVK